MSLGINTNIASLSAQRALSNTQSDAATSMQRLATGLRINSAKDDAAGLAVSNALTSRVNGLEQASRNASDAVSMLQTAEGGLQNITDNLQRIRELAVQASNDSISSTERGYLDTEVQQLIAEIDRVANTTQFNGVDLLDGDYASTALQFQVGHRNNANDRFSINIADVNTAALGQSGGTQSLTGTRITGDLTAGDLTIGGVDVGAVTAAGTGNSLAHGVAAAIEAAAPTVTATVGASTFSMGTWADLVLTNAADADSYQFTITSNGTAVNLFDTDPIATGDLNVTAAEFDAALTGKTANLAAVGITFTGSAATDNLVFTKADGTDFTVDSATTDAAAGDIAYGSGGFTNLQEAAAGATAQSVHGSITLTGSSGIILAGNATTKAGFAANNLGSASTGTLISSINVTDRANALTALTSVDSALATVNDTRADIGAYQARFESVVESAKVASENAQASRSRVLDADFAVESASLAKTQVLQQAGISVLAQANAMPQQVLALLQ
jgi:flagellin